MSYGGEITYGVVIVLLFGLPNLLFSRRLWRATRGIRYFGSRWEYDNPELLDKLEPSGCLIAYSRLFGAALVIAGLFFIGNGIDRHLRANEVATGSGSTGAVAVSLDASIRREATTAGLSPRNPGVANTALVQIASEYDYCATYPSTLPGALTQSGFCALTLQGISLAADYQSTGRITLQPPPPGYPGQTVCLTVAANPRVAGTLTLGACPK